MEGQPSKCTVVIVGGGFTGTATAVNLARLCAGPLKVTVINKDSLPCRGVAYATRNPSHILNVPARNMSALPDVPDHFVKWLCARPEFHGRPMAFDDEFVPRWIFGSYLEDLFSKHAQAARQKDIELEMLRDEAMDIRLDAGKPVVQLAAGGTLRADKVVLALGNQKPAPLRIPGLDLNDARYIGNPWREWDGQLPSPDKAVVLAGTGLTMVDVFLTLSDRDWRGKIYAVSPNGLLPLGHFKTPECSGLVEAGAGVLSLKELFSIFKYNYRLCQKREIYPAVLVDRLRGITPHVWRTFSAAEKRRFIRHLSSRWNAARHRISAKVRRRLEKALAEGRFEVIKGRFRECAAAGEDLEVRVGTKDGLRSLRAGVLINCTGPQTQHLRLPGESPLLDNLYKSGLARSDEMNMGLDVGQDFAVKDKDGRVSEVLFAAGTLLKGTLWETTAVPELRAQAFYIAQMISAGFGILDYCI